MFEVELKYPVPRELSIEDKLRNAGLEFAAERLETDRYFNAPDRDFGSTDEALRLRQIGGQIILTYKGPKQGTVGKTRLELEVPLAQQAGNEAEAQRLLEALGYRLTAEVRKWRRLYKPIKGSPLPTNLEVTLDSVDSVGLFVELERRAEAADAPRIQSELIALARTLGLTGNERRSYLEMLLLHRQSKGASGGGD